MPAPVTFSIVTPSFQQAAYLVECLRSVKEQQGVGVEQIVVDGGSTDGSQVIIERHAHELAWWCSERDHGQAHALNKGLSHARGEVFGWINSDDFLLPGALRRVGEAFEQNPGLMVLTGARLSRSAEGQDEPMPTEDGADHDRWFTAPRVNQQATFYRMSAIRSIGGLEERLRFVMDYELWLQALFTFGTHAVRVVPWELAVFRRHAESKTSTSQPLFVHETASVLHGLCERAGLARQARAIAIGHDLTQGLRPMPVQAEHAPLIARMVRSFMLKWHYTIFDQRDFEMMRAWRDAAGALEGLAAEEAERLQKLDRQLAAGSWVMLRLRNKLRHLLP